MLQERVWQRIFGKEGSHFEERGEEYCDDLIHTVRLYDWQWWEGNAECVDSVLS